MVKRQFCLTAINMIIIIYQCSLLRANSKRFFTVNLISAIQSRDPSYRVIFFLLLLLRLDVVCEVSVEYQDFLEALLEALLQNKRIAKSADYEINKFTTLGISESIRGRPMFRC